MSANDILRAIITGEVDGDLDRIAEAMRERRRTLNSAKRFEFNPGDRVVFNSQANPKYLRGVRGIVKELLPKNLLVDIEQNQRARRYSGSKNVKVPPSIVDRVEEAA